MTIKKISIIVDNKREEATLNYNERKQSIKLTLKDGFSKLLTGQDLYDCLGGIIKEFPQIKFLCKCAKINVRPSSMSSQMTSGIMAYEHVLGAHATRKDVVNIFDYEESDIVSDPQEQKNYFFRWLRILKSE